MGARARSTAPGFRVSRTSRPRRTFALTRVTLPGLHFAAISLRLTIASRVPALSLGTLHLVVVGEVGDVGVTGVAGVVGGDGGGGVVSVNDRVAALLRPGHDAAVRRLGGRQGHRPERRRRLHGPPGLERGRGARDGDRDRGGDRLLRVRRLAAPGTGRLRRSVEQRSGVGRGDDHRGGRAPPSRGWWWPSTATPRRSATRPRPAPSARWPR